jgi:hypothetical protein
MRKLIALLVLLLPAPAFTQVSSTRLTTYDWQCQATDGTRVSDHQREGAAIVACTNLTLKDGKTRYVQGGRYRLTAPAPAPSPTPSPTGTAKVAWEPPTLRTDGSALTNLAGYRVRYGTSAGNLTQTLSVANPGATSADVAALAVGTWFFGVVAYASDGTESDMSALVSKTL